MKKTRNSKKGIAMIMALVISFLLMVMATSYLGITGAGTKAAKNYKQESIALSIAQSGLDAFINTMGNRDNWALAPGGFNVLANNAINLNILTAAPPAYTSNLLPGNMPDLAGQISLNNTVPLDINLPTGASMAQRYIGNNFLGLSAGVPLSQYISNVITLEDYNNGTGRYAVLLFAICPDGNIQTSQGMVKNNVNYNVAVASFIYNVPPAVASIASNPFTDDLVASRVIKARLSFAFPGSIYSNVRAYDVPPNPRDFLFGGFGAPNYQQLNADAAFIDENSYWDSGIRIDGADLARDQAPNSAVNRWGAPQMNSNFLNGWNGASGWALAQQGPAGNMTTGINNPYDSSGSLKVAFLDPTLEAAVRDGVSLTNDQRNRIKSFRSIVSTEKGDRGLVFQELQGAGNWHTAGQTVQTLRENITDPRAPVDMGRMGSSNLISSIWQTSSLETPQKLSYVTGTPGNFAGNNSAFNAVSGNTTANLTATDTAASATQCNVTFGLEDYRADKLYGNQKMEAPTVRVTIQQETGAGPARTQNVVVEQITYNYNTANGNIEETPRNISTVNIANPNFSGVISIRGANVQVASATNGNTVVGLLNNSLTIVSDENPEITAEHANAMTNLRAAGDRHFDDRLTAPNYIRGGQYEFLDIAIGHDGMYDVNSELAEAETRPNAIPIFAATEADINNLNGGHWVYPTINTQSEQPQGNLSIIGDVVRERGSQAELALVAANRVYLNDFGHRQPNSLRPNAQIINDQGQPILSADILANDGILKVDATIASQKHNMTVDFNNFSKNTRYENNQIRSNSATVNLGANVPNTAPGFDERFVMTSPYMLQGTISLQNTLNAANAAGNPYAGRLDGCIDNGNHRINMYNAFNVGSKNLIWKDFGYGAIRLPTNAPRQGDITANAEGRRGTYSQGIFDFTGVVISRFADIEADAGTLFNNRRVNQMGYPVQSMSFNSNLLDSSAPFFSIASGALSGVGNNAIIRWHILSYVDRGSILQQRGI